jgi:hypothetical protein
MSNALWPAIMAWRGRAMVERRRDGKVQIIRTGPVLTPAGYCSVSAGSCRVRQDCATFDPRLGDFFYQRRDAAQQTHLKANQA